MAQAKKKTQTTRKKTAGKASSGRRSPKGTPAKETREKEHMEPAIKKELVILIALAVSVLLFLSNLHFCGSFGGFLYRLMAQSDTM